MELHRIHELMAKGRQASEEESMLVAAVVVLSTQPRFAKMTLEEVYDQVKRHRDVLQPPAGDTIT
jgi:hypothetical protein